MGAEAEDTTTATKTEGGAAAGGTAAKTETKTETKVEKPAAAKTETKTETKVEGSAGGGEKRATLKDDDDPEKLPDDVALIEMTPRALKSRLTRHSNKVLKDRFGTDDPDEIKKQLDELAALKADNEKKRQEGLTKEQKLEDDNKKLKADLDAANARERELRTSQEVEKVDRQILGIGEKYLDPDYVEDSLPGLARYLKKNFDKKQIAKGLESKDLRKGIDDYFKDLVKRKPKLAKETAETKTETVERKPITNGADTNGKKTAQGTAGEKTMRPGQANSMTSREAKAEAAKSGLRW